MDEVGEILAMLIVLPFLAALALCWPVLSLFLYVANVRDGQAADMPKPRNALIIYLVGCAIWGGSVVALIIYG